jgi:DNA invertase Pin-like site-specific DNA recombinase
MMHKPDAKIIGYARVSSKSQSPAGQVEALRAAGCTDIVTEKRSGKDAESRKALRTMLAKAQAGDVIVVTKLDRIARSTRDLLNILHDLGERSIGFKTLDGRADTTTPHGRLITTFLAGVAEFERELIRERQAAGIERAKARGVKLGRKHVLDPSRRRDALALLAEGKSQRHVAQIMGVDQATISRLAAVGAA